MVVCVLTQTMEPSHCVLLLLHSPVALIRVLYHSLEALIRVRVDFALPGQCEGRTEEGNRRQRISAGTSLAEVLSSVLLNVEL